MDKPPFAGAITRRPALPQDSETKRRLHASHEQQLTFRTTHGRRVGAILHIDWPPGRI
jgi:hypothetical protein